MSGIRCILIGCLTLTLASCSKEPTPPVNVQPEARPGGNGPAEPGREGSGHLGETSSGSADARFVIKCPFHLTGDQMTVMGLAEWPGKPRHPAFLLLLKLPPKPGVVSFGVDGAVGSDGEKSYWHQQFNTSGNQKQWVRYEIKHKPIAEQFTLGDQPSSLDSGRIFLLDLTTQPVQVNQLKAELGELLPGGDPGKEDLQAVVAKLRAKHEKVQEVFQKGR